MLMSTKMLEKMTIIVIVIIIIIFIEDIPAV